MNTIAPPAPGKFGRTCSSDPAHNRHRLFCVVSGACTSVGAGLALLVDPAFIVMAGLGGLLLITTALFDSRS